MGQDQAGELLPARLDEGRIGHQHVEAADPVVGEGDAEVDHQPCAGVAVEIKVHADLAGPAERQEDQLVAGGDFGHAGFLSHFPALARWIRIRPRSVRSGSVISIASVAWA